MLIGFEFPCRKVKLKQLESEPEDGVVFSFLLVPTSNGVDINWPPIFKLW